MNRIDFLKELKNVLQTDENISEKTDLSDLYEWDSLAFISVIAFLDKEFGKKISFDDVKNFCTVEDIMEAAGL